MTEMIFWILTILCVVRSCMAVTVMIDGKELDCEKNCTCCKRGTTCRYDNVCTGGCVATISGHRCRHSCPENCYTCEYNYGQICHTCKDTFYDNTSSCSKSCSVGCNNATCNDDGTCDPCQANFEGPRCTTCIQGKYGPDCILNCSNQKCRCTIDRDCISCKKGFYESSTFCQKSCSIGCQNQSCNDDGTCNCTSRFNGTTCTECMYGYHGTNCDELCSVGCEKRQCNKDGTCSCRDYFEGTTCDTCSNGRYGDYCDQMCSVGCNEAMDCYRKNGSCECLPNFTGAKCEKCTDGLYGQSCDLHCPYNCKGGSCSRYEGKCTLGCVDGYSGDNCTNPCDNTCATCLQNDTTHCESCNNGYTGTTCQCPPNCNCSTGFEICISCTNGYANSEKQCTCQSKYCIGSECDQCSDQTFYVDNNACCPCPKNCRNDVCKNGPECISGCMDGFYGLNCSRNCSFLSAECLQCNQTDGKCSLCSKGYSLHENGSCNGCPKNLYGYLCDTKCPENCQQDKNDTSCNNEGKCIYGCVDGYKGDDCTESDKSVNVAAESPVGYIVGVMTVVVIIGVVVTVFFLRRRLARLSPSHTNGSMNTTVKADVIVEN
ncbi:cell death abnormality protein 1-like [Mya arenaria]|uniref:cell death abnormality protein 1-like n=1 Tax=Mya arenaria TaxID=6604 RepID=UPI0022E4D343|nr:cell death abnormality protein 1-like [Mya arenaria]